MQHVHPVVRDNMNGAKRCNDNLQHCMWYFISIVVQNEVKVASHDNAHCFFRTVKDRSDAEACLAATHTNEGIRACFNATP